MQAVNGTQFLDTTPLFFLSPHFAASSAPDSVIAIVSLTESL